MLARWNKGAVTVIDEQAGRFLVLQESLERATALLEQHGLSAAAARAVLNAKCSESAWRAGFVHCAGCTAAAASESLDRAAEAKDVENVRFDLRAAIADLKQEMAEDRRRLERTQLEIHLGREAERMTQVALLTGLKPGRDLEAAIWTQLWLTPAGVRLQELRDED